MGVNLTPFSNINLSQKIFTSRETLAFALRIANELSTKPEFVEIRDPMDETIRGQYPFGGHRIWGEVMAVCPAADLDRLLQKFQSDSSVIAVLYDPQGTSLGETGYYFNLYLIFKDRSTAEAFALKKE